MGCALTGLLLSSCLAGNTTVNVTLAESYHTREAEAVCAASEITTERKTATSAAIQPAYCFSPMAFETLGQINHDIVNSRAEITGDNRKTISLYQHLSMPSSAAICLPSTALTPPSTTSTNTGHPRQTAVYKIFLSMDDHMYLAAKII